jgi:hypothetical protein
LLQQQLFRQPPSVLLPALQHQQPLFRQPPFVLLPVLGLEVGLEVGAGELELLLLLLLLRRRRRLLRLRLLLLLRRLVPCQVIPPARASIRQRTSA